MRLEELENDRETLDKIAVEVEERVRGGREPIEAKIEVFKAHNIEFDEDAMRAAEVEAMELDLDSLESVSGGAKSRGARKDPFCWGNYSCYVVLRHDDDSTKRHACFMENYCFNLNITL